MHREPKAQPLRAGERAWLPVPPQSLLDNLRRLVADRIGLEFGETRLRVLLRALEERRRATSTTSYDALLQRLAAGGQEWDAFVEGLLNGESSFFRHPPSYEALVRHVLPALLDARARTRQLLLWSAGCSTGQEAYSMAIAAREAVRDPAWKIGVLGTDLHRGALDAARLGRYRLGLSDNLRPDHLARHFREVRDDDRARIEVLPQLKLLVHFAVSNLLELAPPVGSFYDVVFCQNVLIYLGAEARIRVVRALAQRLAPGGCLFLAPGELVEWRGLAVEPVRFDDALVLRRVASE